MTPSYLQPYRNALHSNGDVFQSLLWAGTDTQELRFAALQSLCDMHQRTLLDVGCGHADLLDYLHRRMIVPAHYVGLEAIEEFALRAEAKNYPDAQIIRGDFLIDPVKMFVGAEVVVFCGSLNTLSRHEFYEALRRAWDATAEVLLFNFLCSPERAGRDYLTWHRPQDVLDFGGALTDDVKLLDDYLDGDATIRLQKNTTRLSDVEDGTPL